MPETATRERPILFSGPMVRAILEGRKTQTRRVVKDADWLACLTGDCPHDLQSECDASLRAECPFGSVGDALWVRETWQQVHPLGRGQWHTMDTPRPSPNRRLIYAADSDEEPPRWRPSIHMPRWASRITLEITDVRVERLQEIGRDDILAEGIQYPVTEDGHPLMRVSGKYPPCDYHRKISVPAGETLSDEELLRCHFASLWDQINAQRGFSWSSNPLVWAISFRRTGTTGYAATVIRRLLVEVERS